MCARGPHSSQERLHTVDNRVHDRAPQSDRLGRRQGLQSGPPTMFPHCGKASRPPEAAITEAQRLEAAIAVLGETNPHARPLKDALQAAKSRSKVPPVAHRIEACKTFIERATRRVVRAEEITRRALEQKDVYVAEVEDAERRLLQLQAEAVAAPHCASVSEVGEW